MLMEHWYVNQAWTKEKGDSILFINVQVLTLTNDHISFFFLLPSLQNDILWPLALPRPHN